jgi:hypothetical protein
LADVSHWTDKTPNHVRKVDITTCYAKENMDCWTIDTNQGVEALKNVWEHEDKKELRVQYDSAE